MKHAKILPHKRGAVVFGAFCDGSVLIVDNQTGDLERMEVPGITWGYDEMCDDWGSGNVHDIVNTGKGDYIVQLKNGVYCRPNQNGEIEVHRAIDISCCVKDMATEEILQESVQFNIKDFMTLV